jgi:hypothetical protein
MIVRTVDSSPIDLEWKRWPKKGSIQPCRFRRGNFSYEDEIPMPEKDSQFWARFLPEINKIIDGTLASEAERAEVLASLLNAPPETLTGHWDSIRARIEGLARCPDDRIAAADIPLKEAEDAYRDKLAGIETLRLKLADWAGRSIE